MDAIREIAGSCSKMKKKQKEDYLFKEILCISDSDSETDEDCESFLLELLTTDPSYEPSRFFKTHEGDFYHRTVANYNDHEFSLHFRMRKRTFEILMNKLSPVFPYTPIDHRKMVLFTIYMLAHGENYRSSSAKFGLAASSGHKVFKTVITALSHLTPQYIKWPSLENAEATASRFEMICGIGGIAAVIDACHIPIKKPTSNPDDFYNEKKGLHSVLLQGTCDDQMLFLDVAAGDPGGKRHAEMFSDSPLGINLLTSPSSLLSPQLHIIGDCAYPNTEYIVTPITNNGLLTAKHSEFNTRLCTAQNIIKNAFSQLKAKFRRLNYLDITEMDLIVNVILACCVLHNFTIIEKDDSPTIAPVVCNSDSDDEDLEYAQPSNKMYSSKRNKLLCDLEGKSPMRKRRRK